MYIVYNRIFDLAHFVVVAPVQAGAGADAAAGAGAGAGADTGAGRYWCFVTL